MRRRDFLNLASSAAVVWPVAAYAQQPERQKRIGVLTGIAGDDAQTKARLGAFLQELQRLGWTEGRNIRMDIRGASGSIADARKYAVELVSLGPDIILAIGNVTVPPLLEATRSIPIIFSVVVDPVGTGYVRSLSKPGGNVTGFMMFEYSLSGKWPELLKQIAPHVTRAAVLREPTFPGGIGQFAVIQAVAPSVGLEVIAINSSDEREIERDMGIVCAFPKWWPDRNVGASNGWLSQSDRHACQPVQIALGLLRTSFCCGGRIAVLWPESGRCDASHGRLCRSNLQG